MKIEIDWKLANLLKGWVIFSTDFLLDHFDFFLLVGEPDTCDVGSVDEGL